MFQSYVIWLDDFRTPRLQGNVVWCKNVEEFKQQIKTFGLPSHIAFDHDLGDGPNGYDAAKWLVDYCMENDLDVPEYSIQSANPVGKENIKGILENYKKFRQC